MRPLFLPSVLAPWGQCWTQDRKIPGNPWPLQILHHPASCEPRCLTAFSSWEKNKTQKGEPRKSVQIPTDMDCWTYTQICYPKTIVLSKNISCACVLSIQWIHKYRYGELFTYKWWTPKVQMHLGLGTCMCFLHTRDPQGEHSLRLARSTALQAQASANLKKVID